MFSWKYVDKHVLSHVHEIWFRDYIVEVWSEFSGGSHAVLKGVCGFITQSTFFLSILVPPVIEDLQKMSITKFVFSKRTALFWVVTQRVVVTSYRRFWTTYLGPSSGVKYPKEIYWIDP